MVHGVEGKIKFIRMKYNKLPMDGVMRIMQGIKANKILNSHIT